MDLPFSWRCQSKREADELQFHTGTSFLGGGSCKGRSFALCFIKGIKGSGYRKKRASPGLLVHAKVHVSSRDGAASIDALYLLLSLSLLSNLSY